MASDGGERRMLFDIRGRRKNVVKVVYAILAVLMGLSLFLVAGPGDRRHLQPGRQQQRRRAVRRPGDDDRTQTAQEPRRPGPAAEPDAGADQRRQRQCRNQPRRRSGLYARIAPTAGPGQRILVEVPEGRRTNRAPRAPSSSPPLCSGWRRPRAPVPKRSPTFALRRRRSRSSPSSGPASVASAPWRSTASTRSTTTAPRKRAMKPNPSPTPSSNGKTSATNSMRSTNAPANSRNSCRKSKKKPGKLGNRANRASPTR